MNGGGLGCMRNGSGSRAICSDGDWLRGDCNFHNVAQAAESDLQLGLGLGDRKDGSTTWGMQSSNRQQRRGGTR